MDLITLALAKKYTEKRVAEISGEGPSGVQSDWNQNDELASDYIKNRPCYETDPVETVLYDGSIEFTKTYGEHGYMFNGYNFNDAFEIGKIYTIIYDGVVYSDIECTEYLDSGYALVGSQPADIQNGVETEYPFAILTLGKSYMINDLYLGSIYVKQSDGNSHSIKIITITNSIIQLDEKFISYKPGLKVEGKEFIIDDQTIISDTAAEIFNDYEHNKATGSYSHAEGYKTTASGKESHAEGQSTIASDISSHAEGYYTTASGYASHAEGNYTTASGIAAHAEGEYTVASGDRGAHAEGQSTIAASKYQHAQGKYNIEDANNKYAHIVGNGEYSSDDSKRSNAHTLDWNGNAWYAGDVYVGGESQEDENATRLIKAPTTAEIGQTIVVEEVDENGKPIKWKAVDMVSGGNVQADWNQNDETAPDYVKNKPDLDAMVREAKSHSDSNLEIAKTYTDNAVVQKTQVQIITWEVND